MSFNPSDNNNANIKRKPKGSPLALTIGIALVLLAIAGYFIDKNKKATQANSAVTSVQQTTKLETPEEKKTITEDEFNKQLENSVRKSLGESYGRFALEHSIMDSVCRFTLTFENDLTDNEARTAGTIAVRVLLNMYRETGEIDNILQGFKTVSAWINSIKVKTGGRIKR